jgi:hypothetical protein
MKETCSTYDHIFSGDGVVMLKEVIVCMSISKTCFRLLYDRECLLYVDCNGSFSKSG